MKNLVTVILLMWFMVSCGQEELSPTSFQAQETQETSGNNQTEDNDQVTPPAETSTSDQEPIEPEISKCGSLAEDDCLMVSALYRHCASCHAIGNKRFIFDDSFENTLEYITTVNYEENTIWAKSIRDSIDWVDGKIPEVPVYVDSPLAVNATEIFRLHPECFNKEIYDFQFEKSDPFGFEGLTLIRSVKGSKELNMRKGQAIIISASGMCEAGRILHHLKNSIDNPQNTILFIGYCAQNTLGWKIREKWEEVKIFGKPYPLKAHVEIMDSFSGHADHSELIDYFNAMTGPKSNVWLIHGEQSRSETFCDALKENEGTKGEVSVGVLGETVEF